MKTIIPNYASLSSEDVERYGITLESLGDLLDFFQTTKLSSMTLTMQRVSLSDVDGELDNYETRIAARYEKSGEWFLVTADGYTLNVTEMLSRISEYL